MRKNVNIKVSGDMEAVEEFLMHLEEKFALMLKSKIFLNDKDNGVHCFLDLDPYAVKE